MAHVGTVTKQRKDMKDWDLEDWFIHICLVLLTLPLFFIFLVCVFGLCWEWGQIALLILNS